MTVTFRVGREPRFLGDNMPNEIPHYIDFKKICVGKNGVHCFTSDNHDFFIPFDEVTKDVTIYE